MDRFSTEPMTGPDAVDPAAQRTDPRDSLFLAAMMWTDHLPPEQVRVRNLSAGGLMAEFPAALLPDTRVEIDLRGIGLVGGRVAWAREGRVGIAFDRLIDPKMARKPVAAVTRR